MLGESREGRPASYFIRKRIDRVRVLLSLAMPLDTGPFRRARKGSAGKGPAEAPHGPANQAVQGEMGREAAFHTPSGRTSTDHLQIIYISSDDLVFSTQIHS